MRLLSNRVLVKLAPEPPRPDGLILAEAMPLPPCLGKVVQAGPRCRQLQPGQVVLFMPEALTDNVTGIDGLRTPHVIVRETEVDLMVGAG